MSAAVTLVELLAPFRSDPTRAAVLLDVDGTLAPIVRYSDDANVPEATRSVLIDVGQRYGFVACVTGRRAADARRIVSIGSIAYLGNHGGELLLPGSTQPEVDAELSRWSRRVQAFAARVDQRELSRLRVRVEDKSAIAAFHWRGAPDEAAAERLVQRIGAEAQEAGFATHWGRKVLEVRPPVAFDKGAGIRRLLRGADVAAALYVGDDKTDLDAFRALSDLEEDGTLETALRVGVTSDEGPPEIEREADLLVDGPAGVRRLLDALIRAED